MTLPALSARAKPALMAQRCERLNSSTPLFSTWSKSLSLSRKELPARTGAVMPGGWDRLAVCWIGKEVDSYLYLVETLFARVALTVFILIHFD